MLGELMISKQKLMCNKIAKIGYVERLNKSDYKRRQLTETKGLPSWFNLCQSHPWRTAVILFNL